MGTAMNQSEAILEEVNWNQQGLVPAIAQDCDSGEVLMLAWMNREALAATIDQGRVVYWSRSRQRLWPKGETSGNIQVLKDIRLDCDRDTILLSVEQLGGIACHTGRRHCFMHSLGESEWEVSEAVIRDPAEIYGEGE
jgi:phosphoribosyl-AMP cyclohydrolase